MRLKTYLSPITRIIGHKYVSLIDNHPIRAASRKSRNDLGYAGEGHYLGLTPIANRTHASDYSDHRPACPGQRRHDSYNIDSRLKEPLNDQYKKGDIPLSDSDSSDPIQRDIYGPGTLSL